MAIPRVFAVVLALLIFVGLPSLLALVAAIDIGVEYAWRSLRRAWRRRRARRGPSRRRILRPRTEPPQPAGPSIEHIAAELRRLGRARVGVATRSEVWFNAVQHAYDARLKLACRALGVDEHLDGLTGMDLEIERVRVTGALEAAGMVLGPAPTDRSQERP